MKSIRAIDLVVADILHAERNAESKSVLAGYNSEVRINDVELGILEPNQFMPLLEKSPYNIRLLYWQLEELVEFIKLVKRREINFDFISVTLTKSMLRDEKLSKKLAEFVTKADIKRNKLMLMVSVFSILKDDSLERQHLSFLAKEGYMIALKDYGCENFPLSLVNEVSFDIAVLDDFCLDCLAGDKMQNEYATTLINYLHTLERQIMILDVDNEERRNLAENVANFYGGKLAGNFVKYKFAFSKGRKKLTPEEIAKRTEKRKLTMAKKKKPTNKIDIVVQTDKDYKITSI